MFQRQKEQGRTRGLASASGKTEGRGGEKNFLKKKSNKEWKKKGTEPPRSSEMRAKTTDTHVLSGEYKRGEKTPAGKMGGLKSEEDETPLPLCREVGGKCRKKKRELKRKAR